MMKNQRGDTLVEVLLATVIISVVIAGAYALTNRATRLNQTSLERTTASNLMRQQLELIRGARSAGANTEVWDAIVNGSGSKVTTVAPVYATCSPTTGSRPFTINPNTNFTNAGDVLTYSGSTAPVNGLYRLWAEAYRPNANSGYVDFHVRVCWEGIGGEVEQRSALVMRLTQ